MGEIHRVVSVSFRQGLAFVRGNLHRPLRVRAELRNLVPLYLAGTNWRELSIDDRKSSNHGDDRGNRTVLGAVEFGDNGWAFSPM